MNRLIAAVMVGTLVAIVLQLARDDAPPWVGIASLVLAGSRDRARRGAHGAERVRLGAAR